MSKKWIKYLSLVTSIFLVLSLVVGYTYVFGAKVQASQDYVGMNVGQVIPHEQYVAQIKNNAQPYAHPVGSQLNPNQYQFAYNGYANLKFGGANSGSTLDPVITINQWGDTTHQISLAATGLGTLANNTGKFNNTVGASNSNFSIGTAATSTDSKYNELGGFNLVITVIKKQSAFSSITFTLTTQNVAAYWQPGPLVGDGDGTNKVVKVVDDGENTNGLNAQGNIIESCPDYVVNSIALYSTNSGGMVTDVQAAMLNTTGKIGMLYRMKVVGKDGTWAWMDWSVSGNTLKLSDTTGYIAKINGNSNYPLTIAPVGDTFGYMSIGSNLGTNSIQLLRISRYVIYQDGSYG